VKIFFRLPEILQPFQRHWFDDISDSNLPKAIQDILKEIKSFIIQRFKLFEEEIESEELNTEKIPKMMINFSEEGKPEITYVNYSVRLTTKMKESLTNDDIGYLVKKLLSSGHSPSIQN